MIPTWLPKQPKYCCKAMASLTFGTLPLLSTSQTYFIVMDILIGDDGDDMMSNLAWRFFRFVNDRRQSRSRIGDNGDD